MKIEPLYDNLIVRKKTTTEETTPAGIVLHGTNPHRTAGIGEVVAVGEGRAIESATGGVLRLLPVKAGDMVAYSQHAGQVVRFNGEDLLALRADEIIARIVE